MGAMQAAKLLAELGAGERLLSARARAPALLYLYTLCDLQNVDCSDRCHCPP